ncbi:MAG: energy transducer TonB [Acidithiobacillus sp.]|uniref:energy transducer TonB n=1 Tax=Acidithiobacillus sp. TaxID=1872118 RepID=UPI003D026EB4
MRRLAAWQGIRRLQAVWASGRHLDDLFPWLLLSLLLNALCWWPWIAQGPRPRPDMLSTVEIELVRSAQTAAPKAVPAPPATRIRLMISPPDGPGAQREERARPSAEVRKDVYTAYIRTWQQRVLDYAAHHVFGEGHQALPKGRIVVAATIAGDGRLLGVEIIQGQDDPPLVAAVRRIIAAAAPYPPLPAALRRQGSTLRIVRTWNFD